jgi:hypothetical protein
MPKSPTRRRAALPRVAFGFCEIRDEYRAWTLCDRFANPTFSRIPASGSSKVICSPPSNQVVPPGTTTYIAIDDFVPIGGCNTVYMAAVCFTAS